MQPAPSHHARRVLLLVTFAVLFANFRFNVFQIQAQRQYLNLTADEYITTPMENYAAGPARLRWLGNLTLTEGDGSTHPYVMMAGLQRIVFSALSPSTASGVDRGLPWLRTLVAASLALVFTAFVFVVQREFGTATAAITAALLCLSNWLIIVGPSLLWVAATFFAPFVLAWLFGDPTRARAQRLGLAAAFTLLCLMKFLCGYDYITNICAAVVVPFVYYGLLRGQALAQIARRIGTYAALSLAAFATALGLQILQFRLVQPDFRGTVAYFFQEAARRTASSGEGTSSHYDQAVLDTLHRLHTPATLIESLSPLLVHLRPLLRYLHYLGMGAVTLPLPRFSLTIPIGIFIAGFCLAAFFLRKRLIASARTSRAAAWIISTRAALVITHFWVFAANGHMTHTFFNAILFYIPFLPMAYVALALVIARSSSLSAPSS